MQTSLCFRGWYACLKAQWCCHCCCYLWFSYFEVFLSNRNLASEENDSKEGVCAFPEAFISYFGMQSSESRALRCSLRPVQQGLSPLGATLWKAKKYILFDLRFGSIRNCPGTLFTAHKTSLSHGKGKFFFQAKSAHHPIIEALLLHSLSSLSLEQGLGMCADMASGHRGNKMSSGLLVWIVKEITMAPDSLFSTREKCLNGHHDGF